MVPIQIWLNSLSGASFQSLSDTLSLFFISNFPRGYLTLLSSLVLVFKELHSQILRKDNSPSQGAMCPIKRCQECKSEAFVFLG